MPLSNLDALQFLSAHPIDKIVQDGEVTIVHPGADSFSDSSTTNQPIARTVSTTDSHDYQRAGLVRARYSLDDGDNWQDMHTVIAFSFEEDLYFDGSFAQTNIGTDIKSQLVIGSDISDVHIRVISALHNGNPMRVDVNTSTGHVTYSNWSPVQQTVRVQYWLFERD